MLGCEDDIAEAGQPRHPSPFARVEFLGIETARQLRYVALEEFLVRAHHGMADDGGELAVKAPVDEQSEPKIPEPLDAFGFVGARGDNCCKEQETRQCQALHVGVQVFCHRCRPESGCRLPKGGPCVRRGTHCPSRDRAYAASSRIGRWMD